MFVRKLRISITSLLSCRSTMAQPPPHPVETFQSPPSKANIYRVFQHLNMPKAPAYRALMRLFVAAKERFENAMRPAELLALAMDAGGCPDDLRTIEGVAACLESLREWGNVVATRDVVSARTIEEYLNPKYLYQLTQAGEQAERALADFEENLARPGELSALALREIAETLDELLRLLEQPALDEPKAARAMEDLTSRFDTLVARAQMFMGGLQREMDRPGDDEDAFLALKEELLKYLERFKRTAQLQLSHPAEFGEIYAGADRLSFKCVCKSRIGGGLGCD